MGESLFGGSQERSKVSFFDIPTHLNGRPNIREDVSTDSKIQALVDSLTSPTPSDELPELNDVSKEEAGAKDVSTDPKIQTLAERLTSAKPPELIGLEEDLEEEGDYGIVFSNTRCTSKTIDDLRANGIIVDRVHPTLYEPSAKIQIPAQPAPTAMELFLAQPLTVVEPTEPLPTPALIEETLITEPYFLATPSLSLDKSTPRPQTEDNSENEVSGEFLSVEDILLEDEDLDDNQILEKNDLSTIPQEITDEPAVRVLSKPGVSNDHQLAKNIRFLSSSDVPQGVWREEDLTIEDSGTEFAPPAVENLSVVPDNEIGEQTTKPFREPSRDFASPQNEIGNMSTKPHAADTSIEMAKSA